MGVGCLDEMVKVQQMARQPLKVAWQLDPEDQPDPTDKAWLFEQLSTLNYQLEGLEVKLAANTPLKTQLSLVRE